MACQQEFCNFFTCVTAFLRHRVPDRTLGGPKVVGLILILRFINRHPPFLLQMKTKDVHCANVASTDENSVRLVPKGTWSAIITKSHCNLCRASPQPPSFLRFIKLTHQLDIQEFQPNRIRRNSCGDHRWEQMNSSSCRSKPTSSRRRAPYLREEKEVAIASPCLCFPWTKKEKWSQ